MSLEEPSASIELWSVINVGDEIELEADLIEEGRVKLHGNRFYKVLAKTDAQGESHFAAFTVQSEVDDQLIKVAPAFVCNYRTNPHRTPLA